MKLSPIKDSLFQKLPGNIQFKLMQSGVTPVGDAMIDLWHLPEGTNTVVLIGSRGGQKTYGVSDFIARQAAVNKKRCVILRDEKSTIKDSILSEIQLRYENIPFSTNTYMTTTGMKEVDNPNDLVFSMGFRASSNKKQANMKGVSDIDFAIIEEAEDIVDPEKFNTFVDSLRKDGCIVIIILNTPDVGHFILKRYFDVTTPAVPEPRHEDPTIAKEYDGYFQLNPKPAEEIPGVKCIITNYESNPYLPQAVIERYKAYGDPKSSTFNLHYYLTAIKGYTSTGRKGQILRKVKPISLAEYLKLPFREFFGQDFGTASPAGFVGVKFDGNNCYCREISYIPMSTLAIGKFYCSFGLGLNDKIIADSADKDACDLLASGWSSNKLEPEDIVKYPALIRGFWVEPCKKGEGSIRSGLSIMDGLNLFAVGDNLWEEIRSYVYELNKNGEYTNDPIDRFNHLIDPWRYVCMDQRGQSEIYGI